jgi:quercetin dioxygenase-like cupin family protein
VAGAARAAVSRSGAIQVLRVDRDYLPLPGRGDVRAIVWPGMGARYRSMHYVRLPAGGESDDWRHAGEAVYYVLSGSGWLREPAAGERHEIRAGLIVHVQAGAPYGLRAREPLACVGGPCPPDFGLYPGAPAPLPDGAQGSDQRPLEGVAAIRVFDPSREGVAVPMISRQARLVAWPGVGALQAQMNHVILEPRESNVPHRHERSEDTIFVVEGWGFVTDTDTGQTKRVESGCVVHVPAGVGHAVTAETRMVSVGGPCPPDEQMMRRSGLRPA